jgi:hypothetical protein
MPINGSAIESLFDFMAMSKGFVVSAPRSDASQYDRIVDTYKKMYRVQIKARRGKGERSMIIRINRSQNKGYTKDDTDIIALYIEDNNSWYFIPVTECKYVFRVNIQKDKLDHFKNNWSIFK